MAGGGVAWTNVRLITLGAELGGGGGGLSGKDMQ